jgi:hypothetical protein
MSAIPLMRCFLAVTGLLGATTLYAADVVSGIQIEKFSKRGSRKSDVELPTASMKIANVRMAKVSPADTKRLETTPAGGRSKRDR